VTVTNESGDPEYVYWHQPECNKNTAVSAYTLTDVELETVMLWTAEFRIPPGHAGLTGIALIDSSGFCVPYSASGPAWLRGDDDLLVYNYGRELGSNVKFATFNTDDTYDHGWQVRLTYTPMSALTLGAGGVAIVPYALG
jgi:hypothetical protein